MYTSYRIFCWMWYSLLKKGSAIYKLAATGWNPPLPTFTFMTQYSISFIFDFKKHHGQTADPGKKPTVMSTCGFIAEKKLEFLHLFSESSPALRKFLTTRLQGNRNFSEIYVRFFLWFKLISQMFKAATENVSLKGMLRLNFFTYFLFVLFLFRNSIFKLWGKS